MGGSCESVHSALPWEVGRMVNPNGTPLTKEQMKKYVCGCIDMGKDDAAFWFVTNDAGEGDICHTGNGARSKANAWAICNRINEYEDLFNRLRTCMCELTASERERSIQTEALTSLKRIIQHTIDFEHNRATEEFARACLAIIDAALGAQADTHMVKDPENIDPEDIVGVKP